MHTHNPIIMTDSYKVTHGAMLPEGTDGVYSYFEARKGAAYPETVFFGLQAILAEHFEGNRLGNSDVRRAREVLRHHFGGDQMNDAAWKHIVDEHDGQLPLRIKAVPEGTPVPVDNVLMTVESTCPECYWLTNYAETILTHVWYPSTVATLSREVKKLIAMYLDVTADSRDGLDFMLHDFGFRGASSLESAARGGAAHLVNFKGTDTLAGMDLALLEYNADIESLAFSVPATEHSVMTSLGENGETAVLDHVLKLHPSGILSVVADSYDYYRFVQDFVGQQYRSDILARDGVFVVRPDSVTRRHETPEELVVWTLETLWDSFHGTMNGKGYKVLDSHVRVLWGDGIDIDGINKILQFAMQAGFSAENLVFGMGGGLLQKVNRDTQRFAFKSSAQHRDGQWHDVFKKPLDISKRSKMGKQSLVMVDGKLTTVSNGQSMENDLLEVVFENGEITRRQTFDDIRERAEIPAPKSAAVS